MKRGEIENWILWCYGGLCVVLLPVVQVLDAVLTDAPESWYVNFSFIVSASAAIVLVGMLLLGAFQQSYRYSLPVCTALCVWPVLWFLQMFDLWAIRVLDMQGDASLYTILLSVIFMVTALPRVVYAVFSMTHDSILVRHSSA